MVDDQPIQNPTKLAICKFENDNGFYLFYCLENWEVITDTYHDSIEDAMKQAEFEYAGSITSWNHV